MTATNQTNNQLKAIVERIERVNSEIDDLKSDVKDILKEAAGNGFDVKALRTIISIRKQDSKKRAELEAIVDAYMAALGDLAQTPLGQSAISRAGVR